MAKVQFFSKKSKPQSFLRKKEKTQTDKPNSVAFGLSLKASSFIWALIHINALSAYPPALGLQPSGAGLHGISTRGVYPRLLLPVACLHSYPQVFTLTQKWAVIFCDTFRQRIRTLCPAVSWRDAVRCSDFPQEVAKNCFLR